MPAEENSGGERGALLELKQSEIRQLERAIRKGPEFVVEDFMRKEVPQEMYLIATAHECPRNRIAAARVLVAMVMANLRAQELGQKAGQPASPGTMVNVNIQNNDVSLDQLLESEFARVAALREAARPVAPHPEGRGLAADGPPQGGPGADPWGGGEPGGLLAGDAAPLFGGADPDAVQPADRQEHHGGGPAPADSAA
jgi:hypothetical protein